MGILLSEPLAAQVNINVEPIACTGHSIHFSRFYKPVSVSERRESSAHKHYIPNKGY